MSFSLSFRFQIKCPALETLSRTSPRREVPPLPYGLCPHIPFVSFITVSIIHSYFLIRGLLPSLSLPLVRNFLRKVTMSVLFTITSLEPETQ